VAERRDRNQSIKRKRKYQNIHNAYKAKIEGGGAVEHCNNPDLRAVRPGRTHSDSATSHLCDMLLTPEPYHAKPTDLSAQLVRKQISDLKTKMECMQVDLTRQLVDISKKLSMLNNDLYNNEDLPINIKSKVLRSFGTNTQCFNQVKFQVLYENLRFLYNNLKKC
jgi:uncharacterized protein YfkK (UPF0435 family)